MLLLVDLAIRAGDLSAMYTDDGMFPRTEMSYRITSVWNWSFHFGGGSFEFAALLFVIAAGLGLSMLLGFQTRLATIGSWLMLVSIHHRALAILSEAEILLRMLLFWSMFLPLSRRWSVDGWLSRTPDDAVGSLKTTPVVSLATAAILLQMAQMYLFSAWFKSNEQWFHGEALAGSLVHPFFSTSIGLQLLHFPNLLRVLTWATLALEWVGPFLLFVPVYTVPLRLMTILALFLMHLGIGITMSVGMFSYVAITGLVLFLPSTFWDRPPVSWLSRDGWRLDDKSHSFYPSRIRQSVWNDAIKGICGMAMAFGLLHNLNSLPAHPLASLAPESWKPFSIGMGLAQNWGMFGEIPSKAGWYVARAKLRDASEVDLLREGAPLDWSMPQHPSSMYPNLYWRKLFREMSYFDAQGFQVYRAPVAEYLCRKWNASHPFPRQIAEFEFVFCTPEALLYQDWPTSKILRTPLVHLDYSPEMVRPVVSGYGDADPALEGIR